MVLRYFHKVYTIYDGTCNHNLLYQEYYTLDYTVYPKIVCIKCN